MENFTRGNNMKQHFGNMMPKIVWRKGEMIEEFVFGLFQKYCESRNAAEYRNRKLFSGWSFITVVIMCMSGIISCIIPSYGNLVIVSGLCLVWLIYLVVVRIIALNECKQMELNLFNNINPENGWETLLKNCISKIHNSIDLKDMGNTNVGFRVCFEDKTQMKYQAKFTSYEMDNNKSRHHYIQINKKDFPDLYWGTWLMIYFVASTDTSVKLDTGSAYSMYNLLHTTDNLPLTLQ